MKMLTDNPKLTKWSSLFHGEDLEQAAYLDLPKIQMFFFSVVLLIAYAGSINAIISLYMICIDTLPELGSNIIILLSINRTENLLNKVIPKSKTVH